MPGDSRKKEVSASQAELHSAEKQNLLLTPKIQVVPEPQQKVGENEGQVSCPDPKSRIPPDRGFGSLSIECVAESLSVLF